MIERDTLLLPGENNLYRRNVFGSTTAVVSLLGCTLRSSLSNKVISNEQSVYRGRITSSLLMLMIAFS